MKNRINKEKILIGAGGHAKVLNDILILNDDIIIEKNYLSEAVKFCESNDYIIQSQADYKISSLAMAGSGLWLGVLRSSVL